MRSMSLHQADASFHTAKDKVCKHPGSDSAKICVKNEMLMDFVSFVYHKSQSISHIYPHKKVLPWRNDWIKGNHKGFCKGSTKGEIFSCIPDSSTIPHTEVIGKSYLCECSGPRATVFQLGHNLPTACPKAKGFSSGHRLRILRCS